MKRIAQQRRNPPTRAQAVRTAGLQLRAVAACVRADGRRVELEVKDGVLLAYLAIEGPTARAELAARLWPDAEPERARANLRQRLMRLRRLAGEDLITGTDHARLTEGLAHDLEPASDVLASVAPADVGGFAEWLETTRRLRRAARVEQLADAAERAEGERELAAALEHAQALLALDATSEHAHRRVMRLHYLRGDLGAARAAYAHCVQVLARELGVAPAPETGALMQQIERAAPTGGAAVRGPPPVSLLRPPLLVGREEPLKRLRDAWADGRTFLLIGDPGIGKSRLLEEFVAGMTGAALVSCRPGDRALPLSSLARLVRHSGSRFPQLTQHARYAELLDVLPGGAATLKDALPRRVSAQFGALLDTAQVSGIVLDDLQWADEATVEVLAEARTLSHAADVRWGFASRPAEDDVIHRRIARLQGEQAAETVTLGPLDAAMLQSLLTSLSVAVSDPRAAASGMLAKVGGNPLFVLELLRQAHAADVDWSRIAVPKRIVELMDRRLQGLSDGALTLARVAAIAGTDFSAALAESVTGLDTLALANPWRDLETAQVLRTTAFTHDLALAAVQQSIPESIAARVHAKVASFLEGAAADPARIARHHLAAGQDARAVPFLTGAARRAWYAGCAREGADFFFRAADIELAAGRPDVAFDILFEAGHAMAEAGSDDQLARVVELLTRLARTPVQHAKALLGQAAIWLHRGGDTEGFAQRTDAALMQAIAAGAQSEEAECRRYKAYACLRSGRLQDAVEHLAAAETLFRQAGPPRRLVNAQANKALLLGYLGHCEQALEQLRSLAPAIDRSTMVAFHAHESSLALMLGWKNQGRTAADAVAKMLGTVDISDRDWALASSDAGACFRQLGDYAGALTLLDRAAQQVGRSPLAPTIDVERAAIFLDLGRLDLACRCFASYETYGRAQSQARERLQIGRAALLNAAGKSSLDVLEGMDPSALENVQVACDLMFERGRAPATPGALQQAEKLLARCTEFNLAGLRAPLLALTAKFHAELGAPAAGEGDARQALSILDLCIPSLLPLACTWLAQAFAACDRASEAARCLQAGAEWVARTARESVPAEFRDSFLHRNRVHRQLLLAAARL